MNAEISEGLERAMRAAAAANGKGGGLGGDAMGLFMQVLPTLMEKWEERQAQGEEQRDGIEDIRKQVRFVRKQLGLLVQSHKGVLEELRLMRELQSAMVSHLARVQILDIDDDLRTEDVEAADIDDYMADPLADDSSFAGASRAERDDPRHARVTGARRPQRTRSRYP